MHQLVAVARRCASSWDVPRGLGKVVAVTVVMGLTFATHINAQTVWYKWTQGAKYSDELKAWITEKWARVNAYDSAKDCRASLPAIGAQTVEDTKYLSLGETVIAKGPKGTLSLSASLRATRLLTEPFKQQTSSFDLTRTARYSAFKYPLACMHEL